MTEEHTLRVEFVQLVERRGASGVVPSVISKSSGSEAAHIPGCLATHDRPNPFPVIDEHRLMTGSVTRGGDDVNPRGDLAISVDERQLDVRRERPFRHGVARRPRSFSFSSLDDDPGPCEAIILAAVVEVEMRCDDGRDVVDADVVAVQRFFEVEVHWGVEVVDQGVSGTYSAVNQDRSGPVQDEIGEHRKGRPRPGQVRCGRDVREVETSNFGHSRPSEQQATHA